MKNILKTPLLLVVLLPLLVLACGGDDDGNGDEQDTAVDTVADTAMDTAMDTAADTVIDTAADTAADTAPDSSGCVSSTAAAGGTCSVLDLCGCDPGQICMMQGVSDDCELYEKCLLGTPGSLPEGAECTTLADCIPGTICVTYSGEETGHCYKWCESGADCAEGSDCSVTLTLTPGSGPCAGTPIDTPLNVCSLPCPDDALCDPFGGTGDTAGCPDGQQCSIRSDCNISWCFPAGDVPAGGDCSGGETCEPGTVCLTIDDTTSTCVPWCDDEHPCDTGTCQTLMPAYPENPDLGYCYE